MSLATLIDRLIQREGGYVNHAADRGGPTNWGITQGTLSGWRGRPASIADVQALGKDEARAIYKANYFEKPGFGAVSDPELQEFLFDYAVNSGPGAAAKGLQTALQGMGLYKGAIDGGFGPQSQAALKACNNIPELYYRVKCERYELFLRFIGHDPAQAAFATGWANRMDELNDSPVA
jgi:lysozyme family protein